MFFLAEFTVAEKWSVRFVART